ncbi:MAG TPA: hypothetical protein VME23_13770, partial [Terracidiphilus sp.]|nr:hypothetical protein [Terracidiphilus sp.]
MSLPRISNRSLFIAVFDCAVAVVALAAVGPMMGQTAPAAGAVDGSVQPPIAGGHDYVHLLSETVNPATGSLSVRIQLPVPKGRGITAPAVVAYNSGEVSSLIEPTGTLQWATWNQNPNGQANGWGSPSSIPLTATASEWNFTSPEPPQGWSEIENCNYASGFSFTDMNGTSHTLGIGAVTLATNNGNGGQCNTSIANTGESDGQVEGWLGSNAQTQLANGNQIGINLIDLNGNTYSGTTPGMGQNGALFMTMEDRNGNIVSPATSTTGTDTAGRSMALQIPAVAGTYTVYGLQYIVATEQISLNYTPQEALTVETGASNCSVTGIFPANSATITVISSITLPNGEVYHFDYDPTYGVINEIDFPDGGKVTYTWGLSSSYEDVAAFPAVQSSTGMPMSNACTVQYQVPVVTSRTVYFNGSSPAQYQTYSYTTTWNQTVWTSKTTSVSTTDQVTGNSFLTSYQYSPTANDVGSPFNSASFPTVPMEATVQHYDWSNNSTPLDTETEAWYNQFQKACEVHTLNNGQSYAHFYTWQYGFISDDKEYDFQSGSGLANYCTPTGFSTPPGTPTRETVTTFQQFTSPVPPNLTFAKPQTVSVYGNNGTKIAETDYAYDQSAVQAVSSVTSHDETYFPSSVSAGRGNLTTLTKKCLGNGCSGDSVTAYQYDETGQIVSMTDSCGNGSCPDMSGSGHTTTYSWLDDYTVGAPPSGKQSDTYLTQITYPPTKTAHTESFAWSYQQGELTSSTDENSQTTTYQYNDSMDRLTETQGPPDPNNGSQRPTTTISYDDSAPNPSVTTSELLSTSGTWKTSVVVMDGMGHTVQTQLTSDQQGTDYVDTAYDGEGRVRTKSNPHRSGSSPSDGTTTLYYDALGRTVAAVHPDGTHALTCYNDVASVMPSGVSDLCNGHLGSVTAGAWIDSTDERGNTWQRTSDAFGNLTEVMEPNGSTQTPSMETDYSYDGLNDLLSVIQKGDGSGNRDRAFAYDSLGHLMAALNPENSGSINSPSPGYSAPAALSCSGVSGGPWTTCYTYDLNGNLASKEDNRQITISYSYDNLNRLTWKHYSDGVTPANGFGYDGYNENGNALSGLTNVNGRMSSSSNEVNAASIYSYDVMGRPVLKSQCLPGDCSWDTNVQAGYDLAGDVTSLSNGSPQQPITVTYGYDSAERLQTLSSSWTPDCDHPATLFSAGAYGPVGLTSATLALANSGCSTDSSNQIAQTRGYDDRTRIVSESYSASAIQTTAPTGTISLSGSEQSKLVGQAAGTGWVSVSGSEQSTTIYVSCGPHGQTCPQTIYDSGTVTATINGTPYTTGYGQNFTTSTVATNLAAVINNGSLVTATANGSTISLTARTTGSSTNYSLSVSSATSNPQYFSSPSFTLGESGSSLTGGSNGSTSYDTGTITASVNGVYASANWGQGSTPNTIASALASAIQNAAGSFLSASSNGGVVTLTSTSSGYWPISVSVNDTNPNFSSASFSATSSGMNPAGYTAETAY